MFEKMYVVVSYLFCKSIAPLMLLVKVRTVRYYFFAQFIINSVAQCILTLFPIYVQKNLADMLGFLFLSCK